MDKAEKTSTTEQEFSISAIEHDEYYEKIMDIDFPWFDPKPVHIDDLCGWSLDFQTYYILLNLLEMNKPKNILELGF